MRLRRLLASIGRPPLRLARGLARAAGFSAAVLSAACRPRTWRRPVRREFMRTMSQAAVGGVRAALLTGVLFGLAMVYQALYWLQMAGQTDLIGRVLVLVLVREIGPLIVGLILIGRSGAPMLIELEQLRLGGQLRMLEAQGTSPFLLLVVPRVMAFAASAFCLGMVFLIAALLIGYMIGHSLGAINLSLYMFFDSLLRAMGPAEYVMLPLKTVALGFVVGVTSSLSVLTRSGTEADMGRLTGNGFVRGVLAIFVVGGMLSVAF